MSKNDMNTKLLSFYKLLEENKLPLRRKEVAEALLLAKEPMTSAMLETFCINNQKFNHLRRCTITGRFNELEQANIIRVFKTGICEATGSTAKFYSVNEGWL